MFSQQASVVHPVHQTPNPRYDSVTRTQPHIRSRWTDYSGPNEANDVINNDAYMQQGHRLYGYDESTTSGHPALHSQQIPEGHSRVLPHNDTNMPVPAVYCEPTRYGGDPQWTQDGSFSGLSSALMTESRGIQNVPLMSTTGVQYTLDTNGNAWPSSAADGSVNPQPVILTGRACPICGASHYHAHVDSNAPVAVTDVNGMARQLHRTAASVPHAGHRITGVNGMLAVAQQPHYVMGSAPVAEQYVTGVNGIFAPVGLQQHNVAGSVPNAEQYVTGVNGLQAIPQQPHYVIGSVPSAEQRVPGLNGMRVIQQQPHNTTGLVLGTGQHVTGVTGLHVIPQQQHNVNGLVPSAGQQSAYVISQCGSG